MFEGLMKRVGYVRDSILVPSQVHAIKLALKEFEPDLLIDATTGSFRIVWTDKGPRYLFLIDLTSTAAPQLSGVEGGYEGDFDTHVDLVCEIRTTFEAIVNVGDSASYLPRNSQGFTFRVARSLQPESLCHRTCPYRRPLRPSIKVSRSGPLGSGSTQVLLGRCCRQAPSRCAGSGSTATQRTSTAVAGLRAKTTKAPQSIES